MSSAPTTDDQRNHAARIAAACELQDVRMFHLTADLDNPMVNGPMAYSLESSMEYQVVDDGTAFIVTGTYELSVVDGVLEDDAEEDDSQRPRVAALNFQMAALYTLPESDADEDSFRDDEYEAFAATTGQFALYPYARELVATMTGRMGLPVLHLANLRMDIDDPGSE